MTRCLKIIACLLPLAIAAPSSAEEAREAPAPGVDTYPAAEKGADLARMWCSACHVTGTGEPEQGLDAAPPFASLAPTVTANPDHYRTFLTRPHGSMREITLSRDEIDAVLAYISSLEPAR
ncbi:MAG: cytochrome c [Sphingomonadales bacterium]